MKLFSKTTFVLLFAVIFLFSCEDSYDSLVSDQVDENPVPEESTPEGSSGSADFSNYVAIGNSLTAGFMDGALYNMGQQYSLAALIHGQMQYAGASENFNQPDINSELGFNTSVNQPEGGPILGRYKLDTSIPGPSPTLGGEEITPYNGNTAELNNFGVPGILVGQLLTPATGGPQSDPAFNPFYQRFASAPGSSRILGDAIATQPSFFTLWIGNNDVLGYAISGASNPGLLTSRSDFNSQYNNVINQLMINTSANGVVVNIPNLLAVPYFQAVNWNVISFDTSDPEDQATVNSLNENFSQYNQALDQFASQDVITESEAEKRKVSYADGDNPVLINDETLTDLCNYNPNIDPYCIARPATDSDLLTFTAGSVIGTLADPNNQQSVLGIVIPLTDQYSLIPSEITEILIRIAQFNEIIQTAVNSSDRLALYDTQASGSAFTDLFGYESGQFNEEDLGIRIDGQLLQPDFSPNGVFSTDGIHPNPRGNAILANEFIRVIEDAFGANIPEVDVLNLPSVQVCAGNCVSQQQQKTVAKNVNFGL
ncbi:hypothetical protein CK503_13810 [Aliifodinibius salipaludis]|uniref:G-D-S-L family lipolytic protein n=1 Tax=Fodinibius salipaludis TaxID=2032627 RepID=A0A2A2G5E5_9BACT|nr:SGNH/GDSL hydrolase family protein [Aliifodinibius salipaludis]PAU92996.1 hypothetical protein CK503_13810 [Aliifodinibius salipaludis]